VRQTNSLPLFSWLGASTRASSGVVRRVGVPLFVLLAAVLVVPALDAGQAVSKPRLSTAHKAWLEDEAVYIITATDRPGGHDRRDGRSPRGYGPGAFLVWSNAQGLRAERGSDLRSVR